MEIILNIETKQFLESEKPKSQISFEFDLSRCPNVGERLEVDCAEGNFYGEVTNVETYVNLNTNEERVYVTMVDEIV